MPDVELAPRDRATEAFEQALLDDHPGLLYEQAPCGYLSTDADGHVIKANQTLLTWLGYELPELRGRRIGDLLTAGGRIYHETHCAPLLRMQGALREIALDLVRSDGSRFPVLLNAAMARTVRDDRPVVRYAVFDATERRQYERELLSAKDEAEASRERARTLARTLQQTLIPPALPHIPGLEMSARYHPAGDGTEVGGDFYDVFPAARDEWVLVIGDVCGKGAEAAVVTALARYTIRGLAVGQDDSPSHILSQLNDVLLNQGSGRFVSLVLGLLVREDDGWRLDLAGGGHPPALLLRDGRAEAVLVGGSLLGLFPDATVEEISMRLAPDDLLVFFTDGVTEARRGREFFGDDRLRDGVAMSGTADQLADSLLAEVLDFQGGRAADDIAVLVLRVPSATPTDVP